mgnify:CR=1 FL=1
MQHAPFASAIVVVTAALVTVTAVAGCDVCDGADGLDGSFVLRTQDDVDAFPDGKCVRGDLSIGSADGQFATNDSITDVSKLAALELVEGTVSVEGNKVLQSLSLPALTYAGRRLLEPDGNANKVRGGLFINANQSLTAIDLPALTDVGGCFTIIENGALDPGVADAIFRKTKTHAVPGAGSSAYG